MKASRVELLNEALAAAEAHLYQLNLGVFGQVKINEDQESKTYVAWGRHGDGWRLFIRIDVDHYDNYIEKPMLEATVEDRRLAAKALPQLLAQLRANVDRELVEIDEAAEVARAFARGEHDGPPVDDSDIPF